jgi:hypothetical protein
VLTFIEFCHLWSVQNLNWVQSSILRDTSSFLIYLLLNSTVVHKSLDFLLHMKFLLPKVIEYLKKSLVSAFFVICQVPSRLQTSSAVQNWDYWSEAKSKYPWPLSRGAETGIFGLSHHTYENTDWGSTITPSLKTQRDSTTCTVGISHKNDWIYHYHKTCTFLVALSVAILPTKVTKATPW